MSSRLSGFIGILTILLFATPYAAATVVFEEVYTSGDVQKSGATSPNGLPRPLGFVISDGTTGANPFTIATDQELNAAEFSAYIREGTILEETLRWAIAQDDGSGAPSMTPDYEGVANLGSPTMSDPGPFEINNASYRLAAYQFLLDGLAGDPVEVLAGTPYWLLLDLETAGGTGANRVLWGYNETESGMIISTNGGSTWFGPGDPTVPPPGDIPRGEGAFRLSAVPLPGTVPLLAAAIFGVGLSRVRRRL